MPIQVDRLKALRHAKKMTQKEVSEAIHVAERNYRRYEAGTTDPNLGTAEALADLFEVSIDYLVGRDGKMKWIKL